MTYRIDILQRILNLRTLGDRTTSQNEAIAAMAAADKMMRAYRIDEAELALAEGLDQIKVEVVDRWSERDATKNGRLRHKSVACIWALRDYCEVKVVLYNRTGEYRVIGDRPDADLFEYLYGVVRSAMDREYASWKKTQQGVASGTKAAFQIAMAHAINTRLSEMVRERRQERRDAEAAEAKLLNKSAEDVRSLVASGNLRELTSTAMIVVAAVEQKRVAVEAAYQNAYKGVRMGRASGFATRSGSGNARQAGAAAGRRVNFGRPLSGARTSLLN